jgi:hypothetical protein
MNKMNPEIKADWLSALRSGEYQQGAGRLKIVGEDGEKPSYCCLGVLTDLAAKAGVVEWYDLNSLGGVREDEGYIETGVLPVAVQYWAGLPGNNVGTYSSETKVLTELNDDGVDFEEIANIIEENF